MFIVKFINKKSQYDIFSISLKSSLMESENGELRIEILALSPMSRCGLPRPVMAFPRLMPTSGTLFTVRCGFIEEAIVTVKIKLLLVSGLSCPTMNAGCTAEDGSNVVKTLSSIKSDQDCACK